MKSKLFTEKPLPKTIRRLGLAICVNCGNIKSITCFSRLQLCPKCGELMIEPPWEYIEKKGGTAMQEKTK